MRCFSNRRGSSGSILQWMIPRFELNRTIMIVRLWKYTACHKSYLLKKHWPNSWNPPLQNSTEWRCNESPLQCWESNGGKNPPGQAVLWKYSIWLRVAMKPLFESKTEFWDEPYSQIIHGICYQFTYLLGYQSSHRPSSASSILASPSYIPTKTSQHLLDLQLAWLPPIQLDRDTFVLLLHECWL